jgi:hypothetical protein
MSAHMGAGRRRRKRRFWAEFRAFGAALRRIPYCARAGRLEWFDARETRRVVRQFRRFAWAPCALDYAGERCDGRGGEERRFVAGRQGDASACELYPRPLQPTIREPAQPTTSRVASVMRIASPASRCEPAFAGQSRAGGPGGGTSRRLWLPLAAGFIAGGALALGFAQAGRGVPNPAPLPRSPADREAAPPRPLDHHPYVPPVRIGMAADVLISGAGAPSRDSAALRRDGEAS